MSENAVPVSSPTLNTPLPAELSELNYRPVPVLAPVTLVLGLAAISGLANVPLLAFGAVGTVLGILTLLKIKKAAGTFGGKKIALTGLILSFVFLVSGSALHAYNYATEVPPGFERLNFYWLARQKPQKVDGRTKVNPEAEKWNDKRIFVKGYMYPTGKLFGLKEFVLCKDTGQCCFGGNPAIEDMILVNFKNDVRADHRELTLVSVAGTLKTKPVYTNGQLTQLYTLEAEYFK
ncbi:MAG: DUF4190 domain-containing protein [Planctomycetales bacterium]